MKRKSGSEQRSGPRFPVVKIWCGIPRLEIQSEMLPMKIPNTLWLVRQSTSDQLQTGSGNKQVGRDQTVPLILRQFL